MRRPHGVVFLLAAVLLGGCDTSTDSVAEAALFRVGACQDPGASQSGESFYVRITNPDVVAEAEQILASDEERIVIGPLERGDGGFNEPWSWHLDPDSVQFADMTVELCDGCPHMVEEDLDYWIDTVGTYCPWSTELLERVE